MNDTFPEHGTAEQDVVYRNEQTSVGLEPASRAEPYLSRLHLLVYGSAQRAGRPAGASRAPPPAGL